MVDDASVPPITAIPSAFCAPEPALDAIASGSTPHTNAIDVIRWHFLMPDLWWLIDPLVDKYRLIS